MSSNLPFIDIVFSTLGENDVFIEVEDPTGASIDSGEWIKRDDRLRALRIERSLFGVETPRPMSSVPKDGSYIQLWIASGYSGTPMRCTVARYDAEYGIHARFRDYAGNSVFDDGGNEDDLMGWLPLPETPKSLKEKAKDPAYNFGAFGQWMCSCGYANHPLRTKCRNCREPRRS